jgi:hypothetical protein
MENLELEIKNSKDPHDWIPLTFLNLVLQTAFIPNTKMLSALLIAPAGGGKTIKLELLSKFDFVKYTHDITPKHLMTFLDEVDRERLKYLVIPDYISTLGHSKRTVELARGIFRSMVEEGIKDIDVFGMDRHFQKKLKAGLVSGITPEYFNQNSRVWKNDGFLSRFLPFSYSHSPKTVEKILVNIRDKKDTINTFKITVKKKAKEPSRKEDIDTKIKLISYELLENKGELPYRRYQQLVALCNASAVMRDSTTVENRDVELVRNLAGYVNRALIPI